MIGMHFKLGVRLIQLDNGRSGSAACLGDWRSGVVAVLCYIDTGGSDKL